MQDPAEAAKRICKSSSIVPIVEDDKNVLAQDKVGDKQVITGVKRSTHVLQDRCLVLSQGLSLVVFDLERRTNKTIQWWCEQFDTRWNSFLPNNIVHLKKVSSLSEYGIIMIEGSLAFIEGND